MCLYTFYEETLDFILCEKLYMKLYLNDEKTFVGYWGRHDILWGLKILSNVAQWESTLQRRRIVQKDGGASSNMAGIICPPRFE